MFEGGGGGGGTGERERDLYISIIFSYKIFAIQRNAWSMFTQDAFAQKEIRL